MRRTGYDTYPPTAEGPFIAPQTAGGAIHRLQPSRSGEKCEIYRSDLTPGDFITLSVLLIFAFGPYVYAVRSGVSLALATVLSLLLVTFFQAGVDLLGLAFEPIAFLSLDTSYCLRT